MDKSPRKLFVEPTTRCNFGCEMCVKQAPGYEFEEGDLSPDLFAKLQPVFGNLESVVFSGIGEPMLNFHLEGMVALARESIPASSWIGLQTNGSLLNVDRLQALVESGLTDICLSVDAVVPDLYKKIRSGGDLPNVSSAINSINNIKNKLPKHQLRFGIEFVVMKDNLFELPSVLKWVADNGVSFVIVSHLLPYEKSMEAQCLNSPNLNVSRDLYHRFKIAGERQGLNLDNYLQHRWRYHWNTRKDKSQKAIQDLGKQMIQEATANNIPLHFKNLIREDQQVLEQAKRIFEEAKRICENNQIELRLPELFPRYQRVCHFVEEESLFVSNTGKLYPCFFLWHQYRFYQNGISQKVTALSFGDLNDQSPDDVWESDEFKTFREKVRQYNYPFCGNCNLGPCNLFTAKPFEYDCYAIDVPCGGCPWCGGLLQCLQ